MPRTLLYARAASGLRFGLNATQLARLPGLSDLPPTLFKRHLTVGRSLRIIADMPVSCLRMAVALARGKDPGPPPVALVPDFCTYVLGHLRFNGMRSWLSADDTLTRFVLAADGQLFHYTGPQADGWMHPKLLPLLQLLPGSIRTSRVNFPKLVRQFLVVEYEPGALAVLFVDGTVFVLTVWAYYDEKQDGSYDIEMVEEYDQTSYNAQPVVEMHFNHPDLVLHTLTADGVAGKERITIVPTGEEQY
jgi:hypothetical protein